MTETIFITGVSGFIGSHIAAAALERGYNVKGIDIKDCSIKGVEFTKADIRDKDSIYKAMNGSDYVIHLAAITSNVEFEKNMYECYDINIRGFN
ncbi:MAG: NAD-dependent epimerase/dehydratase family protein, partial [Candidatus Micrarchaeia archaeon]